MPTLHVFDIYIVIKSKYKNKFKMKMFVKHSNFYVFGLHVVMT